MAKLKAKRPMKFENEYKTQDLRKIMADLRSDYAGQMKENNISKEFNDRFV